MSNTNKVAVVIESLYIPDEIRTYQDAFGSRGYAVELVARLWSQPSIMVYSDNVSDIPLEGPKQLERLEVAIDVDAVRERLSEYAAVLVAANYTSVRARYFTDDDGGPRGAPAVRLIEAAMRDARIVKGALCHGLWLMTPCPELLAGRRVTCHEVVRADVLNAGAVIDPAEKIVVDGDLVTGYSWHEAAGLANCVIDLVEAGRNRRPSMNGSNVFDDTADQIVDALQARLEKLPADVGSRPVASAAGKLLDGSLDVAAEVRRLTGSEVDLTKAASHRPVLLVASKFGTWASEVTLVAGVLLKAGYPVTVATEDGSAPHLLGPSLDPSFRDGAWQQSVVSSEERDLALRFLDPTTSENAMLNPPRVLDLRNLVRPPQVGECLADRSLLDRYRDQLKGALRIAEDHEAIVLAGGSGAIPGLMADRGLQSLILAFHRAGKPVMAECNGGLAVAQTIEPMTGRSILHGRAVTTHSWLDEYQSGWGWTLPFGAALESYWKNGRFDLAAYRGAEQWSAPGLGGNPLIDSEALFANAAGERGVFFSPPGTPYSVVVDGTLITCRTTPDGYPGVLALIAVLDGTPPLRGRLFIDRDDRGRPQP